MILVSFDLNFFTSIPGMLITGGVLLLLIALIIFIATGTKKNKKEEKEVVSNNSIVQETPSVDVNVTPAEAVAQMNSMNQVNNDFVQQPVEPVVPMNNVTEMPVVEPIVQPVTENTISFNPSEVNEQPVVDSVVTPEVVVPVVENVVTEMPVENNIVPTVEVPVIETPVVEQIQEEVVPATQNVESVVEPKPIYGGTSPIIPDFGVQNDMPRPIYGGANPLENTQSVPIVNESDYAKVEPVVESVSAPEVMVEPIVEVPVTNTEVVMEPAVEFVSVPTVDEAPVVQESVVEQAPVQSLNSVFDNASEEIESLF